MTTAPAIQRPRTVLHTRGTWSARDDRIPSAVWLGILWVAIVGGFGIDMPRFLHEQHSPVTSKVLHVHAFVFTVWLFILTAQVLFVLGDRVEWHKKLGWFAACWAGLMVILGLWASFAAAAADLPRPSLLLSAQFVDIATFVALLTWGFALRRNPAAHRRMMILSTVAIDDAGFSRISAHLLHPHYLSALTTFLWFEFGNILIVVLMAAWDWWRGRLMRSFVIGATALLAAEYLGCVLRFWAPWKAFTVTMVQAWAKR